MTRWRSALFRKASEPARDDRNAGKRRTPGARPLRSLASTALASLLDPFGADIKRRVSDLGRGFVGRDWLADDVEAQLAPNLALWEARKYFQARDGGSRVPGISPLVSQCVAPAVYETAWGESKTGEPKPVAVVYGESGTGKSSFVCRVLDGTFCEDRGGAWRRLHRRILAQHLLRQRRGLA